MSEQARLMILLCAAAVLFAVPAAMKDLWRPDEPRYAEVAREMMVSGDYLVPHVNGEVYREKPPLLFWLMVAASQPVGAITSFTARIPSILAALITVCLVFDLARRMFGPRAGLWSAVILATTYRFWLQSNIGQIDMLLTACTTLSLYALWRWHERGSLGWAPVLYLGAALGLLAKGPPALLVVGLGTMVFLITQKKIGRGWALWVGLPLAVLPVLAWFLMAKNAAGAGPSQELSGTLAKQVAGRVLKGVTHPEAPWYYLKTLPVDLLPWTLFLPWIVVHAWRTRGENAGTKLVLSWTLPALVFFHVIVEKREVYLMPLYPGFAMLTARALIALADAGRTVWFRVAAVIGVVVGVVLVFATVTTPEDMAPYVIWTPIFSGGLAVVAGSAWLFQSGRWAVAPMMIAAQTAVIMMAAALGAYPGINHYKGARAFSGPVRTLAVTGGVKMYDLGTLREEIIFYTETFHTYALRAPGADILPELEGTDRKARAAQVRERAANACGGVLLKSLTEISPGQRAALVSARDNVLRRLLPEKAIPAYTKAAAAEVQEFLEALRSDEPAAVIAPRDEWQWVLSFSDAPFLQEVMRGTVSGRPMVLLVNAAAMEKLKPRQ